MRPPLRIGILLDSNVIPHWAFKMLEQIQASSYAKIVLIVKNTGHDSSKNGFLQKIINTSRVLLYALLVKIEDRLFRPEPNAFEEKDVFQIVPRTVCIGVKPIQKKFSDYFTPDDIEKIKTYDVDVFIRLGFRILKGPILTCAKYGIWSYHHADNRVNRGGPPGFWEVLEGWPETGSVLQILTENLDDGHILYRSYSQTEPLSVNRNKNNFYWKTASFLPRKLKELSELGGEAFLAKVKQQNQHPSFYSHRLYTAPTNRQLVSVAFKHYFRYIFKKIEYVLYFDQWILLFHINYQERFSASFWQFKKIVPPKDRFWADPFVLDHEGKYYVFLEEFLYATNRGHIAYCMIDEKGHMTVPQKIIEQDYHLSYPFTFSYHDEYYMIPETSENRTIDLYKCLDFPEKWEFHHTLMEDVDAVDTTVLQKDDTWWLFTNIREQEGASFWDELFLFSSSDLFGTDWTSHPQNPVISDVKSSRPAGQIFSHNGNLYRPSQNCSKRYGYGMKINQIVTLTKTEYEEICVNDIEPDWENTIIATHTVNFAKRLTVIDGLLKRAKYFG